MHRLHRGVRPRPRSQAGRRPRPWVLLLAFFAIGVAAFAPASFAQSTDSATLLWTAPGDDGDVGTATAYDLRYRTTPIASGDTLTWWNAATPAAGMPSPSPAGATDSVVVQGLDPTQTYYFIIRAVDDASNWSGFSNVAIKSPAPDTTPPAAITDLTASASSPAAAQAAATEDDSSPPAEPPKPEP
jgi:hypothetical protein